MTTATVGAVVGVTVGAVVAVAVGAVVTVAVGAVVGVEVAVAAGVDVASGALVAVAVDAPVVAVGGNAVGLDPATVAVGCVADALATAAAVAVVVEAVPPGEGELAGVAVNAAVGVDVAPAPEFAGVPSLPPFSATTAHQLESPSTTTAIAAIPPMRIQREPVAPTLFDAWPRADWPHVKQTLPSTGSGVPQFAQFTFAAFRDGGCLDASTGPNPDYGRWGATPRAR